MLLSADWVLPVSGSPIRHGALRIRGAHVDDVGRADEMRRRHPQAREYAFPGCTIAPGMVNAHTHLSLTALGGVLPSAPFSVWVRRLTALMSEMSENDYADSAALGALRSLESGVTVVGDVAYGPEALATALDVGLGGVFFWEVFGIPESGLDERLASVEYPDSRACGPRAECGLSPHSMYTSGPDLLRAVWRRAHDRGRPLMLHVAESPEETRLATFGEGPLAGVAARLAHHFVPPRTTPVAYLDGLGVLDGVLAVHAVQLGHGDAARLVRTTRGVALCPTSNAFLQAGSPDVAELRSAGVRLALGTDSAASAPEAHVAGEGRVVSRLDPTLPPEELLRMLTADGARALGMADRFGSLAPGMQADVAVHRIDGGDDPIASFVGQAGPETVHALHCGGVWRIFDGKPTFNSRQIEQAASRLTERMRALAAQHPAEDTAGHQPGS